MNRMSLIAGSLALAVFLPTAAFAQHPEKAMGFDQHATTHHFALTPTGGYIQVHVRNPSDNANRDAIRSHLEAIAKEVARGDFSKPFMTHAENPPGVETMKRLKATIRYNFEPTEAGGRVTITTADAAGLKAIHDFLRYQIKEHATGDPCFQCSAALSRPRSRG